MRTFENGRRVLTIAAMLAATAAVSGCTTIRDQRGYVIDPLLFPAIQAGIDDQRSVRDTLGQPTFTSQFGPPVWYYVSSNTAQAPFGRARINAQTVMAVTFDGNGNVASVDRSGLDRVVYLSPDSDETPTLGRERGFLEDLFGNIGAVGAGGPGAAGPTGP